VIKGEPYNYLESGMDGIVLYGINQYECDACRERFVSIPRIAHLHLVIGHEICCKKEPLTEKEIRFLRKEIGLKSKELAKVLGVSAETVSRWENGRKQIPVGADQNGRKQIPVGADHFLRLLFISHASETAGIVLHKGVTDLLSMLPVKKEGEAKGIRLELSSADWMGDEVPVFCTA
jgi:transcriptional regulator with XRE-family HTH domain